MLKRETTGQRLTILAAVALCLVLGYGRASATAVFGEQLYYTGSPLQITVQPFEAWFVDTIYLFTPAGPLRIGQNIDVGLVYNLANFAPLAMGTGDELIFGIIVGPNGNQFVMGPASRNADDIIHATVDYRTTPTGGIAVIGFEDLERGGDLDYDDAVIQVSGGVGIRLQPEAAISAVPEPGSLILLLFGVAGYVLTRNRKRDS